MRKTVFAVTLALALPAIALAGPSESVRGTYVEARSAQVFIGGCIMNSEAMTIGREAVLAWRIDEGVANGVVVDGLAIVAAIAGEENLGIHLDAPRRTALFIDERASEAQREVLVELYLERNAALFGEVVDIVAAPIAFDETPSGFRVRAGRVIELEAEELRVDHANFNNCGDAQWYEPFVSLENATLGKALSHSYQGLALDARWSDPGKQSAFFGHFAY